MPRRQAHLPFPAAPLPRGVPRRLCTICRTRLKPDGAALLLRRMVGCLRCRRCLRQGRPASSAALQIFTALVNAHGETSMAQLLAGELERHAQHVEGARQ